MNHYTNRPSIGRGLNQKLQSIRINQIPRILLHKTWPHMTANTATTIHEMTAPVDQFPRRHHSRCHRGYFLPTKPCKRLQPAMGTPTRPTSPPLQCNGEIQDITFAPRDPSRSFVATTSKHKHVLDVIALTLALYRHGSGVDGSKGTPCLE